MEMTNSDEEINNIIVSPSVSTSIVQTFDNNVNNFPVIEISNTNTFVPSILSSSSSSSIIQIPDNSQVNRVISKVNDYFIRNNEFQKCRVCAATYSGDWKNFNWYFKKSY